MLDTRSAMVVSTASGLRLRERGRPDAPIVSQVTTEFVIDQTIPTWDNTGPDLVALGRDLTPYTGPSAGGVLTINGTFGALRYVGVDFGNTRIKRAADALAVTFEDCSWTANFASQIGTANAVVVEMRFSPNAAAWTFTRCSFDQVAQNGRITSAVHGENFTMTRCRFRGFHDSLNVYVDTTRQDQDIRIELAGCWIDEGSLWWDPATNVVHPSDNYSHTDLIQMQGGRGLKVHGCWLGAYFSTKVGVGTPRSGSEYVTGVPYTQAQGEAQRATALAAGHRAVALMVNIARGDKPMIDFHHNWGGGGNYWMNAAGPFGTQTGVTYNFGTIHHNVVKRDQLLKQGGQEVVFGIDTTGVVDYHDNYFANPDLTASTTPILRTTI